MSFDYLKKQLKVNGFSGLYIPGGCQCSFHDFMPCQEWHPDSEIIECIPGYCHKSTWPDDPDASKYNQLYFVSGEKNIKVFDRIIMKKKEKVEEQGLLF